MTEKNTYTSIKNWAEDDRPREKLELKGRAALSDAELLAILLGSGSRNESALDLARRMLQKAENNLNRLGRWNIEELKQFKGVGTAKAINIISALELGKRRRLSEAQEVPKITSSKHVYELMQPRIADLSHEEFWVLYLNHQNKVLATKCISKGGISGTMADVRIIYKEAILLSSSGIILAHNHPSGSLRPSYSDEKLTKKIKQAGEMIDILVLDHLIVTEAGFFSFADEGYL